MRKERSEKEIISRRIARNKYCRENIIYRSVALNKNTDADIIEFLKGNKQTFSGYVRRLIKEDIKRGLEKGV